MSYADLHCHSYYSFHDGASSVEELVLRARELGYAALALTDHDNLCGALEFARCAHAWGLQPIMGAELTLQDGSHLTLLAENHQGYSHLCRLISLAHLQGGRRSPGWTRPSWPTTPGASWPSPAAAGARYLLFWNRGG